MYVVDLYKSIKCIMAQNITTIKQYINELPEERQSVVLRLYEVISRNLPKGFEDCIQYGMPAFVVPHSLYPSGYHCDPKLALPFISISSQKNSISLYHMGLYAGEEYLNWFQNEWPKHSSKKLDMGKSCIRFKKEEDIPFVLIAKLCAKITPQKWIDLYETNIKR